VHRVDIVFLAAHVLAACVWVGGTIVLVFIAVPYARTLTGEARAQALRALGRGWRMFGWGAMLVAVVTGIELAAADGAFDDASSDFDAVLVAKIAAVGLLIAGAFLHDFVLGPRLARQIRAGRPETVRRPLVIVGWANLALTLTVPVLGAALGHLS
jgi:putative copper resistance protein D